MHQQIEEKELEIIQKFIPNATPESLKVFKHCMARDAVYKCAIPCTLATSLMIGFITPKKPRIMKPLVTTLAGITMFTYAKFMYTSTCCQKAFGTSNPFSISRKEREYVKKVDDFDQQNLENKYPVPSDNFMEEEAEWNNFDSQFESNSNEFNNTNDHLQEELTNKQQKTEKHYVTYDDLWTDHKMQQRKQQNIDGRSYTSMSRVKPVENQQKKLPEESAVLETEIDEMNIFS